MRKFGAILCLMLASSSAFAATHELVEGRFNGGSNDNPKDVIFDPNPKMKACSIEIKETGDGLYTVVIERQGTMFLGRRGVYEEFNNVQFKFQPGANDYHFEAKNDRLVLDLTARRHWQLGRETGKLLIASTWIRPHDKNAPYERWQTCQFGEGYAREIPLK